MIKFSRFVGLMLRLFFRMVLASGPMEGLITWISETGRMTRAL